MSCTRPLFNTALNKCGDVLPTFTKLDEYYVDWESQPDADKKREDAYEKNKDWCDRTNGYIMNSWERGVFFDAGMFVGQERALLEGKPTLNSPVCEPPHRDQSHDKKEAAVQFAAGYYWGIEEEDKRDYMVGCFEQNDLLNSFLYSAFEHYDAGDQQMGDAMMSCTRPLYNTAIHKCDDVLPTF